MNLIAGGLDDVPTGTASIGSVVKRGIWEGQEHNLVPRLVVNVRVEERRRRRCPDFGHQNLQFSGYGHRSTI